MGYRCERCKKAWSDANAECNRYLCHATCQGSLLPAAPPPGLTELDGTHLPYPAALSIQRLRDGFGGDESAWDRAILLRIAVEATVRSFCVYGLGVYVASTHLRTETKDVDLLDLLARPALGHWVELLRRLCTLLRGEEGPCDGLYALFFSRRKGKDSATPAFAMLEKFVQFRNEFSHGGGRAGAEFEGEVNEWLVRFSRLLAGSRLLANYPLMLPTDTGVAEVWSGTERRVVSGSYPESAIGHLGFVRSDGRFVDVEPFVMLLDCVPCGAARLFFYDSQESYGRNRRVNVLEYNQGHRLPREEPAVRLESRFSEEALLRVYEAFRFRMLAVERYLQDFGRLVGEHAEIVGREYVLAQVKEFLARRQSGILLITGEPGIGKTAFLANLVRTALGPFFFYRRTSGLQSPDDFVKCILQGLASSHRYKIDIAQDPGERLTQMRSLLLWIARNLGEGRKEVVIVDALDEAITGTGGRSAVDVLPTDLPENVYFVVSSRPRNPDLAHLVARSDVETFELRADSGENAGDVRRYVHSKLAGQFDAGTRERLATWTEGNFLVARHLCETVGKRGYAPIEIGDLLAGEGGLQGRWYSTWWRAIRSSFDRQPDLLRRLSDILGGLATARSPVSEDQICKALQIPSSDFEWGLGFVGQYLDAASVPEARVSLQRGTALVLYQIYHLTFQEFILAKVHSDLRQFHAGWARTLVDWQRLEGHERRYALDHLPRHLEEAGQWEELVAVLEDPLFLTAKEGSADLAAVVENLRRGHGHVADRNPPLGKRVVVSALRWLLGAATRDARRVRLERVHVYLAQRDERSFYGSLLDAAVADAALPSLIADAEEREGVLVILRSYTAEVMRREGDLSGAEAMWRHVEEQLLQGGQWKAVARVAYERAYIRFLQGRLPDATALLDESAVYARRAGDLRGEWISRSIQCYFRFLEDAACVPAVEPTLCEGRAFFREAMRGAGGDSVAELWDINVTMYFFEMAFAGGDETRAALHLRELEENPWFQRQGVVGSLKPFHARRAMLAGRWAQAVQWFEDFLATDPSMLRDNRLESASRHYLDLGDALVRLSRIEEAVAAWRRGLECRDDLGNHAWRKELQARLDAQPSRPGVNGSLKTS